MESLNTYNHFDFGAFVRRSGTMTLIGIIILVVVVTFQLLVRLEILQLNSDSQSPDGFAIDYCEQVCTVS